MPRSGTQRSVDAADEASSATPTERSTRERMLDAGLALLLERGYHGLGTAPLLEAARAPKGSFYHHFRDKEDFALQVVDEYMSGVHGALDACLDDPDRPPLERVRSFFEVVAQGYQNDGYLGCLLGGLGQELSGTSDVFAAKIESCLAYISARIGQSLAEAQAQGDIDPSADPDALAGVLVNCWEGAALRSRLTGSPAPLTSMLDFYFAAARQPQVR
jgi:TetR/AcrR family transcriptional repressor of nem operon